MSLRPTVCAAVLAASLAIASPAQARSGTPTKAACVAAKKAGGKHASRAGTCRRVGKARRALPARTVRRSAAWA